MLGREKLSATAHGRVSTRLLADTAGPLHRLSSQATPRGWTPPPALELAGVFRLRGEVRERANAGQLGRVNCRAMSAIVACRAATLGGHVE